MSQPKLCECNVQIMVTYAKDETCISCGGYFNMSERRRFEVGDRVQWGEDVGEVIEAGGTLADVQFKNVYMQRTLTFSQRHGQQANVGFGPPAVVIVPTKRTRIVKVWRWERVSKRELSEVFRRWVVVINQTEHWHETFEVGWVKVPGSEREIEVED